MYTLYLCSFGTFPDETNVVDVILLCLVWLCTCSDLKYLLELFVNTQFRSSRNWALTRRQLCLYSFGYVSTHCSIAGP